MNRHAWLVMVALAAPAAAAELDNDYVRVTRDAAPCASSEGPGCAHRVIVALGDIELVSDQMRRTLSRGDVAAFAPGESYTAPTGSYLEVAIKPGHPASDSPGETIPPEKNAMLYDAGDFFVFEEKLAPGDTRARHSHSQRVVIQLNRAKLRQWPDGKSLLDVETVPDRVGFSAPVIHVVKNLGAVALRGVIIEFRPGRAGPAR